MKQNHLPDIKKWFYSTIRVDFSDQSKFDTIGCRTLCECVDLFERINLSYGFDRGECEVWFYIVNDKGHIQHEIEGIKNARRIIKISKL